MSDRRIFLHRLLGFTALMTGAASIGKDGYAAPLHPGPAEDLERIRTLLAGKEPLKWVFVGDSITQGAKHTFGARSYPEIFSERVRYEMRRVRDVIINTAISGNTSLNILNDYDWRVRQFQPHVVFIMVGTNDASVAKGISVSDFGQNLSTLVRRVRADGAVPVLQTPNIILTEKATGRERLPAYIAEILQVAAAEQTILVDHWAYWTEQAAKDVLDLHKWMNDELHPNGRGHVQMAIRLFAALGMHDPQSFTGQDHAVDRH